MFLLRDAHVMRAQASVDVDDSTSGRRVLTLISTDDRLLDLIDAV